MIFIGFFFNLFGRASALNNFLSGRVAGFSLSILIAQGGSILFIAGILYSIYGYALSPEKSVSSNIIVNGDRVFCRYCGQTIKKDENYCNSCGKQQF